jgi:hypothetical protein
MEPTSRSQPVESSRHIINRLTALWGLNEAGLGGIMHAVRSPFTGIFVGGIAIILIAMIAHYAERKSTAVLRATLIVIMVKALVSPYSPLPAYAAVCFQGLAGAVLFRILPSYRLGALLLGILGLSESAWQKIIITTLIYGNSIWESIDLFFNYLTQLFGLAAPGGNIHFSIFLISCYAGLYLLAGVLIGYLAGIMPAELERVMSRQDTSVICELAAKQEATPPSGRRRRPLWRRGAFRISVVLFGIIIILTLLNPSWSGVSQAVYVLIRTVVILAFWYFAAAPLLNKILTQFLNRKRKDYSAEVGQVLLLLPHLRGAATIIWNHSAQFRYGRRLKYFLLTLVSYTLTYRPAGRESGPDEIIGSQVGETAGDGRNPVNKNSRRS